MICTHIQSDSRKHLQGHDASANIYITQRNRLKCSVHIEAPKVLNKAKILLSYGNIFTSLGDTLCGVSLSLLERPAAAK